MTSPPITAVCPECHSMSHVKPSAKTCRIVSAVPGAITPDERYSNMYRVRLPDGSWSDMVNRTRARDAARIISEHLDASRKPQGKAA
jgi:hypothetical protein